VKLSTIGQKQEHGYQGSKIFKDELNHLSLKICCLDPIVSWFSND
jgi:hypothetical protein